MPLISRPCSTCRTPLQVKRWKKGPFLCSRCAGREVALVRIKLADDTAARAWQAVNGKADLIPLLIGWLQSVETSTRAARHCLEALANALPGEVFNLTRCAEGRADWARGTLAKLAPLLEAAIGQAKSGRPLQVLSGGGETSEPRPRPTLAVVPREGA